MSFQKTTFKFQNSKIQLYPYQVRSILKKFTPLFFISAIRYLTRAGPFNLCGGGLEELRKKFPAELSQRKKIHATQMAKKKMPTQIASQKKIQYYPRKCFMERMFTRKFRKLSSTFQRMTKIYWSQKVEVLYIPYEKYQIALFI